MTRSSNISTDYQWLQQTHHEEEEAAKPPSSRKRPSRRAVPTTLLTANANNFRALVQKFTGCSSTALAPRRGPVTLSFGPTNDENGTVYYNDNRLTQPRTEQTHPVIMAQDYQIMEYHDRCQTASYYNREKLICSATPSSLPSENDHHDLMSGTSSVSDAVEDFGNNDYMEILGEFGIDDIHALLNNE